MLRNIERNLVNPLRDKLEIWLQRSSYFSLGISTIYPYTHAFSGAERSANHSPESLQLDVLDTWVDRVDETIDELRTLKGK